MTREPDNHPQLHDLTALAYGMVSGDERTQLLEHVHGCDTCRGIYDSYLEEQALVREVLYRDARSGAAEAHALERTLYALRDTAEAVPSPHFWRLPTWGFVAKAAAVIVLALVLLVVIKPRPERDSMLAVSPEDTAPVSLMSGNVLTPVADTWRSVDAVPKGEWVMCGEGEVVRLRFVDGGEASVKPGTVFRIVLEGDSRTRFDVLQGEGQFCAGLSGQPVRLSSRAGDFIPLSGSVIDFDAQCQDGSWTPQATSMRRGMTARTAAWTTTRGRGVYLPESDGYLPYVLFAGEKLEVVNGNPRALGNGQRYELGWRQYAPARSGPRFEPQLVEQIYKRMSAPYETGNDLRVVKQAKECMRAVELQLVVHGAEGGGFSEINLRGDAQAPAAPGQPFGHARAATDQPLAEAKRMLLELRSADEKVKLNIVQLRGGAVRATVHRVNAQDQPPEPEIEAESLAALVNKLPADAAELLREEMAKAERARSGPGTGAGSTGPSKQSR